MILLVIISSILQHQSDSSEMVREVNSHSLEKNQIEEEEERPRNTWPGTGLRGGPGPARGGDPDWTMSAGPGLAWGGDPDWTMSAGLRRGPRLISCCQQWISSSGFHMTKCNYHIEWKICEPFYRTPTRGRLGPPPRLHPEPSVTWTLFK